jgi:murein DD-endopeptidase MepM/ murein hydrolase activator NlpD
MRFEILLLGALLMLSSGCTTVDSSTSDVRINRADVEVASIPRKYKYQIPLDEFTVEEHTFLKNQVLSEILYPNHISYTRIQEVVDQSKSIYDVRKLRTGQPYTLFLNKDSLETLAYMIYEIDKVNYLVYDFTDSVHVFKEQKPVQLVEKSASGIISSSLWNTAEENNLDQELILQLADVYAWTVDFYHLQKGDAFKVVYTERQVEGKVVGIEKISAAIFIHHGTPLHAYVFDGEFMEDYFDEKGNSLRKAFLRAPVKFSRISSRYSKRRFHPVQKRYKAHLGTDYAAPAGTPILATGDGTVIASSYGKYNGNYVKIKHNATYTTQYLHMSKRAVKLGDRVKQGDVIGYVGSTGLATGPHVCYRFWKNGKQVNPYQQKLPASDPVKPENLDRFFEVRDSLQVLLDQIIFPDQSAEMTASSN